MFNRVLNTPLLTVIIIILFLLLVVILNFSDFPVQYIEKDWHLDMGSFVSLQTHHVDSTLKRRGNGRLQVVST